ncbi:myb-like protein X [Solenopsis invicta]|uniref:myb-like protein X n=1 Tax=Solenopsis invicta TaxID=13686 RepID=UPI00193E5432|nr:myb-like protein X [Solenopsis invicta]
MKPLEKKKEDTISKVSGRKIKRPKKVETTSSEEEHRQTKKAKPDREKVKAEILRLRQFVENMKENEEEKETENEKRVHSSSEEETKDYLSSEEKESTGEIEDKHSSEEHFPSKELGEENYNPPTAVLSPKKIQENQTFSDLPLSNKNITKERNAYPSENKCIECNCTEILERLKNFEDNTVKCLKKVMKSNKELVKMVKRLKDNKVEVARTFYQALESFPLQTIEQFHEFENNNSKNNQYDNLKKATSEALK